MPPLESTLRRRLENTVVAARGEAEAGARAALESLAVHHHEPYGHMKPEARALRNHLRARARQLGDVQNARGELAIGHLVHECAYEHWHRMLFARFLAENHLLIDPVSKVAVSLAECEELAKEEGVHTWELAARFAQAMLPQIFRVDDPLLKVALPTERRVALETLLAELPPAVFTADDSLGWVYQFWQRDAKNAANEGVKSGAKIDADTLPAVTQLFTEHYMVLFLLHNTVGAWWAGKQMAAWPVDKAKSFATEAECRAAVALPGYSFEYLRFVKEDSTGSWRPAAGTYPGWPKAAKDLKVLDPCCGSGHFLVATLELLVRLRMVEDNLDARTAALAVIADNLFGLELDARCTQIAAFNVALAAWKLAGDRCEAPELHVACSGLGPSASLEQWLRLADKNSKAWAGIPSHARQAVINGLTSLHRLFSQAPELGSLIDPAQLGAGGELFSADWETLRPFLAAALATEKEEDAHERAVAAQGMAKAAEILTDTYTLVVTNLPYLTRQKQSEILRDHCAANHESAKGDLAASLVDRWLCGDSPGATIAVVCPQNQFFLPGYKAMRKDLLSSTEWNLAIRLGPRGFQTPMYDFNVAFLVASSSRPQSKHRFRGIDVADKLTPGTKDSALQQESLVAIDQTLQLNNPDCRVLFSEAASHPLLSETAKSRTGTRSGDNARFLRGLWEVAKLSPNWIPCQSTVTETCAIGGKDNILLWEQGSGSLSQMDDVGIASIQGAEAWGRNGVAVSLMGSLPVCLYHGDKFDMNTGVIWPHSASHLAALWCFCSSPAFHDAVRVLDQQLKLTTATLVKVPFDLAHWQKVAAEKYPNGLPEPQSDDPTQWLFHGHPAGRVPLTTEPNSHTGTVLQVAVARLAGYKWPAELDAEMPLASEARAWVEKCKDLESHADDDGVIPLVPMRGEPAAEGRVRDLLRAAFGSDWSGAKEASLLAAAAAANGEKSPAPNLDDWLKNRFFAEHCALFHHRPFVWHIWDGRKKDGFGVLVHYHRLAAPNGAGRRLLEKIAHGYLGDWIARQRDEVKAEKTGAEGRLADALELQKKLEAILAGEPPYDIFVRWKPLHEQPIGWEPDINDGVRMNIRPFVEAGVLREKVNIKWKTDRGQEPQKLRPKADFPWFWNGKEFKGDRVNDVHLTNEEKQQARYAKGVK